MSEKIYLSDIAGYDEEKAEAKKIIEVLQNHKKYANLGAYIPKGLILSGEPGVGKTMLAKAIATESGVPFYEFESNESETESATIKSIKDIFKKARETAPSIIFIDELDELVMTSDFASDYSRKTTKILLTEIDGISSSDGVLVIATTNFRSMLPPSLVRSGRMDKRITVEMPDSIDREEIIKLYLSKNELLSSIDAGELALKTGGFSGADIKTLINETIIDCTSRDIQNISLSDFERNIPVVKFQDIRKKTRGGPSTTVCYHEIGHFVTEYVQTGTVGAISTERFGSILGHVIFDDDYTVVEPTSRETLKSKLVTMLGGMAGEDVMCGDITSGASSDVERARLSISSLMSTGAFGFDKLPPISRERMGGRSTSGNTNERIVAIESFEYEMLTSAYNEAKQIIMNNKPLVEVLFKELKQKEKLSKREIEIILNSFNKTDSKVVQQATLN